MLWPALFTPVCRFLSSTCGTSQAPRTRPFAIGSHDLPQTAVTTQPCLGFIRGVR